MVNTYINIFFVIIFKRLLNSFYRYYVNKIYFSINYEVFIVNIYYGIGLKVGFIIRNEKVSAYIL